MGNPIDASEVSIVFEDSIIVDTAEQKRLSLSEIDARVISREEYRQKYYGETPEEAKKKIEEIGEPEEKDYGGSYRFNNAGDQATDDQERD